MGRSPQLPRLRPRHDRDRVLPLPSRRVVFAAVAVAVPVAVALAVAVAAAVVQLLII